MPTKRKYTILGASGHIGSVISEKLLQEGHEVRVVARSEDHLKNLIQKGGKPFAAQFNEVAALTKAMEGADAAFVMIPPDMTASDYRAFQKGVGEAIVQALQKSGVKQAVNLSSVGGHLSEKTGPILGLHDQEERLNGIPSLNVVHLRPGYFMENLFHMIDLIRTQGIAGDSLRPDVKIPWIATRDIAGRAVELLQGLDFHNHSTMELLGERDLSMSEVIPIIGKAIGKADLKYVQFPYEAVENVMKQMGMSDKTVSVMLEMSRGFNDGFIKPTESRSKRNSTPTSIEEFAKTFAAVFQKQ